MNLNEFKLDIQFRYNHILKIRNSDRDKEKFLASLYRDISSVRDDIKVVESRLENSRTVISRNLYVGDIKKADYIFATYYDTPLSHLGSYFIFDDKKNMRNTLYYNIVCSIVIILISVIAWSLYFSKNINNGSITNLLIMGLFFGLMSMLIGKTSRGIARRKNLIRNTSSVIWLLQEILENDQDNGVAYAFLDNGTRQKQGLDSLIKSANEHSKIFYIDCLGSGSTLYIKDGKSISPVSNQVIDKTCDRILYIFCSTNGSNTFEISSRDLRRNELNFENFNSLSKLLGRK